MNASAAYRERHYGARDGLVLFFRDYWPPEGSRLPLLCLPGLSRNSRDFHELALRYRDERRVIAPDYRGRGHSAWAEDPASYAPEQVLDDILQLLAVADLDRVVVLGTSFGGLLAMGLAAVQPTRLAAVVLNDAAPEIDEEHGRRILARIADTPPQPDFESALAHVKTRYAEVGLREERHWRSLAESCYLLGDDGLFHASWDPRIAEVMGRRLSSAGELWRLFQALSPFPLLVVRGGASPLVRAETLDAMAALKPDMVTCVVPGLGHAPSLEEREASEAIDDFLHRLDT